MTNGNDPRGRADGAPDEAGRVPGGSDVREGTGDSDRPRGGASGAPDQNGPSPSLVVMAAGIGSRYGGLKQVDPVGPSGEMILDYSVYDAIRAGFGKVVFVIRRDIEADFRKSFGRRIERHVETAYAYQDMDALPPGFDTPAERTKPWGTGHAVLCARGDVPGAFAAINADDFYGAGAFAAVGRHLSSGSRDYCMAGYRLDNTLSEHGHVSRGVCDVTDGGLLAGITERESIRLFADGVKYLGPDGDWVPIPADAVVSMNMWGFGPGFFDHLESGFGEFLDAHARDDTAEYYLPSVVNRLVARGLARVRVLPTEERWFGITYRDDRPAVVRALLEMTDRSLYPRKLWD